MILRISCSRSTAISALANGLRSPARRSGLPFLSPTHRTQSTTTTTDGTARPCPSCSTPLPHAISPCPQCSILVPLSSSLSPYALLAYTSPSSLTDPPSPPSFDLKAELSSPSLAVHGFDIDPKDARRRMLVRQTQLHPDKYGGQGERVVSLARTLSGRINEAYSTLASPLKRAEYILGVYDTGISETDSLTDPDLLMEVMEAREELESASSAEEVESIRQQNDARIEETVSRLRAAFGQTPPDLDQAKELAVQLKYWYTMEAAAKERHF